MWEMCGRLRRKDSSPVVLRFARQVNPLNAPLNLNTSSSRPERLKGDRVLQSHDVGENHAIQAGKWNPQGDHSCTWHSAHGCTTGGSMVRDCCNGNSPIEDRVNISDVVSQLCNELAWYKLWQLPLSCKAVQTPTREGVRCCCPDTLLHKHIRCPRQDHSTLNVAGPPGPQHAVLAVCAETNAGCSSPKLPVMPGLPLHISIHTTGALSTAPPQLPCHHGVWCC